MSASSIGSGRRREWRDPEVGEELRSFVARVHAIIDAAELLETARPAVQGMRALERVAVGGP